LKGKLWRQADAENYNDIICSVKNLETAADLGIHTILYNRDNVDYDGIIINSFEELSNKLDS